MTKSAWKIDRGSMVANLFEPDDLCLDTTRNDRRPHKDGNAWLDDAIQGGIKYEAVSKP